MAKYFLRCDASYNVFQHWGRLGYQLDWIDGGLEFTDKGLVFGPSVRFGLEGRFI